MSGRAVRKRPSSAHILRLADTKTIKVVWPISPSISSAEIISIQESRKFKQAVTSDTAVSELTFKRSRIELSFFALLAAVTVFLFFHACHTTYLTLLQAPVNPDAGFYLSTARSLAQGETIYKSIYSPYTPVGISLMSLLYPAADHLTDPYLLPLLMMAACHIILSFLVYILLRKSDVEPIAAIFTAVLCYNLCLRCEGDAIVLESPTIIFGLLALVFFVDGENRSSVRDMFFAGVCAGLCFLCKQYGLAVMAVLTVLAVSLQSLRLIKALLLGQAAILLAALSYLLFFGGVSWNSLLSVFQNNSFIRGEIGHQNFFWFLSAAVPGVWLSVLLFPLIKRSRNDSAIIGGLLISLSFGFALLLRDYYHYLIMLIPGLFVFGTAVIYNLRLPRRHVLPLLLLIWSPTVYVVIQQSIAWPLAGKTRAGQYELSKAAAAYLPKQSPTLLLGDTAWSYLLETSPVSAYRPSFATIDLLSTRELQNMASRSKWLLLDLKSVDSFAPQAVTLMKKHGSWENLLSAWGFTRRAAITPSLEIWEARPKTKILVASTADRS